MPTPVAAARQCLTQESAAVLDEAVAVARRRGHAQTTSLHMVSSLLSLPTSSLRDACTRTRNNAYSTRVQFKALELSLSVSLDRLPSSQATKVDEPPVSNSLMAAIKRSQANQRRQPENFSFYQQQQQQYSSCSSVPLVKVELQNLIVSILDDPLVSRVFGEAGFRSCDIKMATLRPGNSFHPSQLFGYSYASRYKRPSPPLFLCNLSGGGDNGGSDVGSKSFSFPFMGCFSGDENENSNENSRRIGETKTTGVLPDGLTGLCVVCLKDDILRFLNGDCDEGTLKLRFEEAAEGGGGGGVLLNFGDLGAFVGEGVAVDRLSFLVGNLGRLVEVYGGNLWLIGSATSYEVYFKILNRFPSIEEDWKLGVLPITSIKFSMGGLGSYPRSSSFVPLGGFFSMPPETRSPLSNTCQYVARCHLCNEKYEQEVAAVSNGGLHASVAEKHQSTSPSWLKTAEAGPQTGLSSLKGTDDRLLLNAKIMGLQKKWDNICQQHHFGRAYTHQLSNQTQRILGFQVSQGRKGKTSNECSDNSNQSSNEQGNKNASSSSLSTDRQKSSSLKELSSWDMQSKDNHPSVVSKSDEVPLEFKSPHLDSLSASVNDDRTSPTSVTSVTTDLGLGIVSTSTTTSREAEKPVDHVQQSSLCFHHDNQVHSDIVKDPKLLCKALIERVGHQEEAVSSIVEAITQRHTRGSDQGISCRRNIWINVRGADRLSKKKLGLALAEILYRSRESLIYVDLSFQDEISHVDALFTSQITNKYELTMRGTVVDYLVEKLSKKPCVVFLDNIDKADLVVQNSLLQAVKSGRFTDFCGREVNVSNCIFLGATRFLEGNKSMPYDDEEDVESAKGSSLQIVIRFDLSEDHDPITENSMNKRKLIGRGTIPNQCRRREMTKRAHKGSNSNSYLDLNLPAEVSEICNAICVESDSDSSSENSRSWLEDLDRQVDQTVVFKKLDFAALGEKLFKRVAECLHDAVGSECAVEIEEKAMQQIVAAAYLHGNKIVEDWMEQVLRQGFVEAMGKFSLTDRSIVRLVVCDQAQHQGLLPPRVTLN
ncbi:hypothetical protein C2S51_030438 [Perilla frutescens var. frutescens]|nr:hypothetical protein C2S51_030438 [Perilla frutescens var. frutescens]